MSIVTFIAILLPNPTIDCCMIYMHHTAIMLTDIIIIEYEWSCPGRCRVLRHRKGQIQNRKLQVVTILTDTRSLVAMLQWQWWWWWWRSWGSACYCWGWGWLKIVVFVQVFSMFCSVVTMLQTSVSLQTIAIIAKFSDITLIAQSVSQSAETIMIAGATGAWQRTVSCKTSSTAQKLTPTSTLL